MTTNGQYRILEILGKLREVCSELEEIFNRIHSLTNVFRSLVQGVNFEDQMLRARTLENRVQALAGFFFHQAEEEWSPELLRWSRAYYCQMVVATAALAEITLKANDDFANSQRFVHSDRQDLIERFLAAMREGKKIWQRIPARAVD